VLLQNRAGRFVAPTTESFQAAAASADWKEASGFYVVLTDQSGEQSWPITGASFILMYREQDNPMLANQLLGFFDWCYKNGADQAEKLHYVPMPAAVTELVRELWQEQIRSGGKPVWP